MFKAQRLDNRTASCKLQQWDRYRVPQNVFLLLNLFHFQFENSKQTNFVKKTSFQGPSDGGISVYVSQNFMSSKITKKEFATPLIAGFPDKCGRVVEAANQPSRRS